MNILRKVFLVPDPAAKIHTLCMMEFFFCYHFIFLLKKTLFIFKHASKTAQSAALLGVI